MQLSWIFAILKMFVFEKKMNFRFRRNSCVLTKGCSEKNLTDQILFSLHLESRWSDLQHFGVHNTPIFMGDRHTNFEYPITWTWYISKTKFDLLGFFPSPFNYVTNTDVRGQHTSQTQLPVDKAHCQRFIFVQSILKEWQMEYYRTPGQLTVTFIN